MKSDKYYVYEITSELTEQTYDCSIEESFYPPVDKRYLKSNVKDIIGGDNFADYCEYIFDLLEEEGYYD